MSDDTVFFWAGVQDDVLLVQECCSCARTRHPPRPACPACHSLEWQAVPLPSRGVVHSYTVHHHPPVEGFELPFVAVVVELDDGTRLVSNLVVGEDLAVHIGMPVEVVFEADVDGWKLHRFREVPTGG